MRVLIVLILLSLTAACAHEPPPSPLRPVERLLQSSRTELCTGALADALNDVRRSDYEWEQEELDRTLRWSFAHNHDDCGTDVSGRAIWREAISAWGKIGGPAAGEALVASLRTSYNLSKTYERRDDGFDQETEAALQALQRSAPHGTAIIHDILRWYGGHSAECAVEPFRDEIVSIVVASGEEGASTMVEYFPPPRAEGRCAPGWMLSEVIEGLPQVIQERVVTQVVRSDPFGEDVERMLEVVDGSSGPLQAALSDRACTTSLVVARRTLDREGGDPRNAAADTFAACASVEGGPQRLLQLQRRLTRWLVANDAAEEAWSTLESMPAEDVDDEWFFEVGSALVYARIQSRAMLEAVDMYEALRRRLGENHIDLQAPSEALRPALIQATQRGLEEQQLVDAGNALAASIQLFGETEETSRLLVLVAFAEATQASSAENCPEDDDMQHLYEGMTRARDLLRATFRRDSELQDLQRETTRSWHALARRCRFRPRRR